MKRILWYWLPPLALMGLIFFLSAQPDLPHAPGSWLDMVVKKTGHAFAFGLLAWLYIRGLGAYLENGRVARPLGAALAVLYAISDEYHQTFVPGRHGRLLDVLIDCFGVGVAFSVSLWLARRRAHR